ncbi:hypothetical protein [Marinobacter zhejiangensis]|uniref:Lipase modulator n=1 Tax=Marinobacter zhejiangensis TaxID=488535 RepID=A0A1I4QB80_9GAMM|nr:hypothetical protein [Marinobacter zhejiangensis]SFM36880.1 hypothetical protein SAMN04487963_2268 [Marinobacter zhejiangensis]
MTLAKKLSVAALVAAVSTAGWLLKDSAGHLQAAPETASSTTDQPRTAGSEPSPQLIPDGEAPVINALAIDWLERFGETIHDPVVQAQFAELKRDLINTYPDQGETIFLRALWLAFPTYAQEILTLLAKLQVYEQWLVNNDLLLRDMAPLEREGVTWRKRLELFGPVADLIWAEEKAEWARRQQAVQQVMATLDQARQYSLDETLFQLQSAIEESYGGNWRSVAMDSGVVANVFFGFESVQAKLRDLPAERRQQEINRVRTNLGYSAEQVARLAERDQRRNQRWDNGLAYMADRSALSSTLAGDELVTALVDLREHYFAHEAVTIAQEEADGFFRYQRPRYFGRN